MVGMKAVIRNQHDSRVVARQFEQPPQQHVMKAVAAAHHIVIQIEQILGNAGHFRRMKIHEAVRKMVNCVVIDRREIPRLILQNPRRRRMNRRGVRDNAG